MVSDIKLDVDKYSVDEGSKKVSTVDDELEHEKAEAKNDIKFAYFIDAVETL